MIIIVAAVHSKTLKTSHNTTEQQVQVHEAQFQIVVSIMYMQSWATSSLQSQQECLLECGHEVS